MPLLGFAHAHHDCRQGAGEKKDEQCHANENTHLVFALVAGQMRIQQLAYAPGKKLGHMYISSNLSVAILSNAGPSSDPPAALHEGAPAVMLQPSTPTAQPATHQLSIDMHNLS
jgi:hypothetical protein